MEITNKFIVCPHPPYNDSFIIKIYYNSKNNCDLLVIREDEQRMWGLDLNIKLFNDSKTDSQIINIGNSPDCVKFIKNYQTRIDLIIPNIDGNPYRTYTIPEKGKISVFTDDKQNSLFEKLETGGASYAIPNFSFDKNKNAIELSSEYGLDTILFANLLSSSAKLYSFEFIDKYYKIFQKNLSDNKINDKVVVLNDSLFYYTGKLFFKKDSEPEKQVICLKLDDLKLENIGLIIANSPVLNIPILFGAKDLIKNQKPVIYIKYSDRELDKNSLSPVLKDFDPVIYCMKELNYKTLYVYSGCKILVPV